MINYSDQNHSHSPIFTAFFLFMYVFTAVIIVTIIIYSAYRYTGSLQVKEIEERQMLLMNLQKKLFIHYLQLIKTDVLNLASSYAVNQYITEKSDQSKEAIYSNFYKFLKHSGRYDQVRFIDKKGNEKIRVNYNNGRITLSVSEQLQNKRNRYYFTDTIGLDENQLYMSDFDLNMEQGKLELPLKPTIRFATPIVKNNQKEGIVIVNLLGDNLIGMLKENYYSLLYDQGTFLLLNQQSHFLIGKSKDDEFRFMFPDMEDFSFRLLYEEEWETFFYSSDGQLQNERGLFTYSVVNFRRIKGLQDIYKSDNLFVLVSLIDKVALERNRKDLRESFLLFYISLALFTGFLSFFLGFFNLKHQKAEQQLKLAAFTDPLTSLLNRRFFIELFEKEIGSAIRYHRQLSVIMGDIDFFKQINDTYGHEAGDFILKELSALFKDKFRKDDSICRWGGEEFVILLTQAGKNEVINKSETIRKEIENASFFYKDQRIIVTMSFGTATFDEKSDSIASLIKKADIALYESKKGGRNRVTAFDHTA